ncbi:helix-turn-helix transcriptional regulator [Prosthecomicrobium sp. N25]|uniref:helix-turn-helix transcriptional regulator n=1 Tax=Prosthecomicrobium sp. N25 TaxID=3129254 RepID=UPI00307807F5
MSATTLDEGQDEARRKELAAFLRAMREQHPSSVPPAGGARRRRTTGLLREEVALSAGISTTWYVWLEQARPVKVSARALEGIARALKLDPAKRDYMFGLARPDLKPTSSRRRPASPGPLLGALVASMSQPVYVLDARWDFVLWNRPAEILFGGFDPGDDRTSNMLARLFLDPGWRVLFPEWEAIVHSAVAQFRAATAGRASTPEVASLLEDLLGASREFAALWNRRDVSDPPVWSKRFRHPTGGEMMLAYSTYRPEGPDQEFRVTIYQPVDDASSQRLAALLAAVS